MKIPNEIILNGEIFEIRVVNKKDLDCEHCGEDALGIIKFKEKIIYIAGNDDDETPIELLLHELGHYWSNYYGLGSSEAWAEGFGKFVHSIIKQLKYK